MEYALTLTDFGQGKTPIVLPVSRCTPQKMSVPRYITGQHNGTAQYSAAQQHSIASQHNLAADSQPYSAFEILQKCFHEDIEGVLNNYLQMEKDEIQRAGILPNAQRMRLRAWHYYKTLSKLQQPTEATVVDFIIKGQVEGEDWNNRKELQNLVIEALSAINRRTIVESASFEFLQFIADCYRLVRYCKE